MVAAGAARRVSYVVPPPAEPVQHLLLPPLSAPRNGRSSPLIVPATPAAWTPSPFAGLGPSQQHPRHRLGVASLALDASTQLQGRAAPEGILYTGGRDGLILSWDLGMRMRKRKPGPEDGRGPGKPKPWEAITGWDDDFDDDDDELPILAGDVLGDVSRRKRANTLSDTDGLPWEDQWEVHEQGPVDAPANFRQSVQAHTDWVNDLLLCNLNQTVISASSDGTIKAWNPHSASSSQDLAVVGQHPDYVKCLAHSRAQTWVASGSYDRTIKLWDLSRAASSASTVDSVQASTSHLAFTNRLAKPLVTLTAPEGTSETKASIYALATDADGQLVASGSPERIVRLWDARSGKCTGKLVGHTDNIRGLVVSADGRWLLSGSADASIKLWSLASPQRCLHTFSHHISSVWSLASLHPQLSTFYSGDRDGLVCRVDVGACDDIGEGECIVLAREENGVCSIAPVRAGYDSVTEPADGSGGRVFVAAGSSDVHAWRDIRPRRGRFESAVLRGELVGSPTSEEGVTPPTQGAMAGGYAFPRTRTGVAFTGAPQLDRHGSSSTGHGLSISSLADLDSPSRRTSRQIHRSPSPAASLPHAQNNVPEPVDPVPEILGVPVDSMIRLGPPGDGFGGYPGMYSNMFKVQAQGRKDADAATLYSAASIHSGGHRHVQLSPHAHSFSLSIPPLQTIIDAHGDESTPFGAYLARELASTARPLRPHPLDTIAGSPARGIVRSILLNDRMHALTVDTCGEVRLWDVVRCVCKGVFVGEQREEHEDGNATPQRPLPLSIASKSPREALEEVRERIEGEVVANSWASVDTRIGELTVHMSEGRCFEAEMYADEAGYGSERAFEDDLRLNMGKWVLSNLFAGFVREQVLRLSGTPPASRDVPSGAVVPAATHASHMSPAGAAGISRDFSQTLTFNFDNHRARAMQDIASPGRLTAGSAPTPGFGIISVCSVAMTPVIAPDGAATPLPATLPSPPSKDAKPLPSIHLSSVPEGSPAVTSAAVTPAATLTPTVNTATSRSKHESPGDYFVAAKARRPGTSGSEGEDLPGWTGSSKGTKDKEEIPIPQTPTGTSGGGLKGRLKMFVRPPKRPVSSEGQGSSANKEPSSETAAKESDNTEADVPFSFASTLPSPLTLPTTNDAPPLYLPPHCGLMISEETADTASGWVVLYNGSVGNTGDEDDLHTLERAMPTWLVDYLFSGRIPPEAHKAASGIKISFVLIPYPEQDANDTLPEVMNIQARLTASRFLRTRKVANYIRDTLRSQAALARPTTRSSADEARSIRSVTAAQSQRNPSPPTTSAQQHLQVQANSPSSRALNLEDTPTPVSAQDIAFDAGVSYELLCNDMVLPAEMTLATVRQYVWKSSSDLVMHYHRSKPRYPGLTQAA
ncbi:hypothetical protein AURDEDRAFT_187845 [Auricularia subglabra TFB-10046 SS5]|nr:hypothetical protein AURDEDRAFT_187845 [Auricularia subglabra TFB-10046 SS5]